MSTVALLRLPYLVQQQVMDQIDLIDIFAMSALSTKARNLVKYYLNRQRGEIEYFMKQDYIWIHRNRSCKDYTPEKDLVEMRTDGVHYELRWSDGVYCELESYNPDEPALKIPVKRRCKLGLDKEMFEFVAEMFLKPILHIDFPAWDGIWYMEYFTDTIDFMKSLNATVKSMTVGEESYISDKLMRAVLNECSDVKSLTIRSKSTGFRCDLQEHHPPFNFDFFELKCAGWVTKDRLITQFLKCEKLILSDRFRMNYSDQELTEICEKWLEAPEAEHLEIQSSWNFSEGIGELPGAVPVKEVQMFDGFDEYGSRLSFAPGKCYKMEKADGTPVVVYYEKSCVVFTTEFQSVVVRE